ncbi:helix-turn-helix domain-containing protein [Salsipaludibacter albus]|uniref:helix-turn-helix domain-containing protein n=1 Tax=Salsipaludibacter albus TaxID=2849650 RepID=UPI001EE46BE1|nr:helix-turn-helix domain-containing protein [Salsipaludibacter albus]
MTSADVIYQRRVRVLTLAAELGSVAAACRAVGVSRASYYLWKAHADAYGLDALRPRARRRPRQPNETPLWQVEIILAEAMSRPTLGARQLLVFLADRGIDLSASGVQKVLNRHQLGRRSQRLTALAQVTAVTDGPVVDRALEGRSGSATSPPNQAIWSPWTPSTSASSRAWARSGSSPPSTPTPAGRSCN